MFWSDWWEEGDYILNLVVTVHIMMLEILWCRVWFVNVSERHLLMKLLCVDSKCNTSSTPLKCYDWKKTSDTEENKSSSAAIFTLGEDSSDNETEVGGAVAVESVSTQTEAMTHYPPLQRLASSSPPRTKEECIQILSSEVCVEHNTFCILRYCKRGYFPGGHFHNCVTKMIHMVENLWFRLKCLHTDVMV